MSNILVQQLYSTHLEQRPASLRFTDFSNQDGMMDKRLVVGSYQLDDNNQCREGAIYVFDIKELQPTQNKTAFTGGVFRFEANNKGNLIAALSSGYLAVLHDYQSCLKQQSLISVCDGMLLNCCSFENEVLCTNTAGKFFVVDVDSESVHITVNAHSPQYGLNECEVWSCAWLGHKICATGAEDAILKLWDLRASSTIPQKTNAILHSAGVISISKYGQLNANEMLVLTGAYDDHLRLFDFRKLNEPVSELKLNGGPWDVKPIGATHFVVACMYGGWSIVRLCPTSLLELVHCHSENGRNLLYGVDFVEIECERGVRQHRIASCTFNDRMLCLDRIMFPADINL